MASIESKATQVLGKFQTAAGDQATSADVIVYEYQGRMLTKRQMQTQYKYGAPYATQELYLDYRPEYDDLRRMTKITNATVFGGSDLDELAQFTYSYDKAGNRLENAGHRGTGNNAAGFDLIQDIDAYTYDGLYRLTDVDYSVGGATTEVYVYDDLGNRITYARDSTDIVYTNNEVNEYGTIDTAGGGAVSVYYDAAGNLSRDENDFEYVYDYDNRLVRINFFNDPYATQVAAYEYDALGRMVSSQLRFDSDTDGDTETLKYYYDGQNAIAEYDMSDNLSRRYVHGTQYVDERALLIEGEPATADTYYYLLQELSTVAGLIKRNGTLVEAYTYDAYGKVQPWGYRDFDFNRDGDVDKTNDQNVFLAASTATGGTTSDPMADADMDGDADKADSIAFGAAYTGSGAEPIKLKLSAIGNPYFFTGRRLHYVEDLAASGLSANKQVQYNRARHYDPEHGRWLQRDPLMYVDGMNLYEYVRNRPVVLADPAGLFSFGTINSAHDALMHYLIGVGTDAALGNTLLGKLKALDFYQTLMVETIPDRASGLAPRRCCVDEQEKSVSGSLSSVLTAPVQYVPGGGWGTDPNYSFDLNNAIGTINSIQWKATCTVGSSGKAGGCCLAYVKRCKVHFTLDDFWTFNTGWKDQLFQWVWGDFFGGQSYNIHNEWNENLGSVKATRICGG